MKPISIYSDLASVPSWWVFKKKTPWPEFSYAAVGVQQSNSFSFNTPTPTTRTKDFAIIKTKAYKMLIRVIVVQVCDATKLIVAMQ
jgi:hypothetical protein